jgi:hypothetical protein
LLFPFDGFEIRGLSADVSAAQALRNYQSVLSHGLRSFAQKQKYVLLQRYGTGRVAEGSGASATIYQYDFTKKKNNSRFVSLPHYTFFLGMGHTFAGIRKDARGQ